MEIAQRIYFCVCNFYGFIFLGLILLGIYFFGCHKKCLGQASLSYTSQRTLPGLFVSDIHLHQKTFITHLQLIFRPCGCNVVIKQCMSSSASPCKLAVTCLNNCSRSNKFSLVANQKICLNMAEVEISHGILCHFS